MLDDMKKGIAFLLAALMAVTVENRAEEPEESATPTPTEDIQDAAKDVGAAGREVVQGVSGLLKNVGEVTLQAGERAADSTAGALGTSRERTQEFFQEKRRGANSLIEKILGVTELATTKVLEAGEKTAQGAAQVVEKAQDKLQSEETTDTE